MKNNLFNKKSLSFMFFDFGTSPIPTIHTTFIFSVYFVNKIAVENGSFVWGLLIGFTGFLTAIIAPFLGSYTDKVGNRKFYLFYITLLGTISTALLFFAKPNIDFLYYAILFSVISIISMELIFVLYNSLLSVSTSKFHRGKISGFAWFSGYIGGILSLLICLFIFILPNELPFNIEKKEGIEVRICMLFVAMWLIIFTTPLFFFINEPKIYKTNKNTLYNVVKGIKTIYKSLPVFRYFLSRVFYFDGLVTLFAFGGIYASKVFNFTQLEILYFAILINISAALGAIVGGYFDDKITPFRTIRFCLLGLIFSGFFLITIEDASFFWIISFFLGFFIGPIQSSSRVLITSIVPEEKGAQFFGFAIFSGKITSFFGPVFYGIIVNISDSHRLGMLFVIFLFILALIVIGNEEPKKINYD